MYSGFVELLSFSVFCDLGDLRSFPTRRSSDLVGAAAGARLAAGALRGNHRRCADRRLFSGRVAVVAAARLARCGITVGAEDRKSTRLNSSHVAISYAVFCLKKKI